ncbi:type I deoxyribonuclease HsdR [Dokdonia pacifica]|uniref:Vitamin K-dependent gamma-carboxylase n=1 Tax=Dokdonia pacifica TaxID=1627892 RepID=A0A238WM36_9FLAO|nr:HTTM domain-containing protein [Dokdonia pacifica]GGG22200.1 type I deoxyribonuclease HsdR [Dokdonia pacifica]SNR47304.1 Vitamin K-dependent gamma-carboxylase [Dokdonia pacifica]
MKVNQFLFSRIDNSPLVVFRVFFGLLIMLEAWGAIATGWVKRIFVDPEFTFNFIGFDFLQTFPGTGPQMYVYFVVMGIFGLMVMLGYRYRLAIIGYAIMWSAVYLMQKSAYNNHYYLLMLLLWIMALFPAHTSFSLDAKRNPTIRDESMPRWVPILIIAQLWIVYTYASIAKLYPDWLDGTATRLLMSGRKGTWLIGDMLQWSWVPWVVAYVGILFDGLIIPALLWKKTRKWAFGISIFFHLFNSVVFQIGIFPYMSLAFTLFFFPTDVIHRIFVKKWKLFYQKTDEIRVPKLRNIGLVVIITYLIVQIALPSRHWLIDDNVLWSEEGHRLSWRMMLRTKSGTSHFTILDKETKKKENVNLKDYLSKKQMRNIRTKPDVIWQFAQRLKREYAAKGQDISVFVNCRVRINGRKSARLIDPKVDLAAIPWDPWNHTTWLLDSKDYLDKE